MKKPHDQRASKMLLTEMKLDVVFGPIENKEMMLDAVRERLRTIMVK